MTDFIFLLSLGGNWSAFGFVGQFLYIILVTAIVGLLAYWCTRMMAAQRRGRRGGNLAVLESVSVVAQAMVQLVRAGEKYLVIGVTRNKVTLLTELDKSQVTELEAV